MQVFRIKHPNFTPNLLYTTDNKDYESFLNIRYSKQNKSTKN